MAWGQRYIYHSSVNNEFGAGESSYITAGYHGANHHGSEPAQIVKSPWNTIQTFTYYKKANQTDSVVVFPSNGYANTLEDNAPLDIILGTGNEGNTVIRAFTGNGFAMGWLSVLDRTISDSNNFPDPIYSNNLIATGTDGKPASYKTPTAFGKNTCSGGVTPPGSLTPNGGEIVEFSFNKFTVPNYTTSNWGIWPGSHKAPCGNPLFEARYPVASDHNIIEVTTHIRKENPGLYNPVWIRLTAKPAPLPYGLYTSTIDGKYTKTWAANTFLDNAPTTQVYPIDDGVALVQFSGENMNDGLALSKQPAHKLQSDKNNPLGNSGSVFTTPDDWGDVTKTKDFTKLTNYRRPTTVVIQGEPNSGTYHRFDKLLYEDIKWKYQVNSVVATPDNGQHLSTCCSGPSSAYAFTVTWTQEMKDAETLVDGAIALQPNAWVCVENDVKDATTSRASAHDGTANPNDKTDAILVFPDVSSGGRFTLRVRGDIDSINMAQRNTSAATPVADLFFKQGTFPTPAAHISLTKDAAHPHPFNTPLLGQFKNNNPNAFITHHPIAAPPAEAVASIFGVYGSYNHDGPAGKNAIIHTDTASLSGYKDNIPGVIELGPSGAGRGYLYVHSGGIVKNFESCTTLNNFTMNFGGGFGTPKFDINSDSTLYIMNYGNDNSNGCAAQILFHETSNDTLQSAINTAGGDGALRIQALSNVEFRTDETWTPPNGNNLLVLSDGGNVVSQTINYTGNYKNGIGEGLLTFWAEEYTPAGANFSSCNNSTGNRNSLRGNVYMNHDVSVTRAPGGSTETNVIAANNVRTTKFTFTSTNTDKDTTNILSRMGDLYLGYGEKAPVYVSGARTLNTTTTNTNLFDYTIQSDQNKGVLNIKAGFDDTKQEMTQTQGMEGGNVYFTGIKTAMAATGEYPTFITIPYSSEYICDDQESHKGELLHNRKASYQAYEHSGIIGGVGACGIEGDWIHYGKLLEGASSSGLTQFTNKSLEYTGNKGDLTVDAGKRGNIIMNTGTKLNYQDDKGNAIFRTREGDIDMRDPTDVEQMKGSLLFLAQLENLSDLAKIGVCGCDEERNNVYLQDFQYKATGNSGSVFVGADNNIKLNYGGLTNIGTRQDPFLSQAYKTDAAGNPLKVGRGYTAGSGCGTNYHCDLDGSENQARDLILNFRDGGVPPAPVTSGGFAAVASDMIDVYKDLKYYGGTGSGLSAVPGTGTLHGENVAGYGLFMKTQGNKANWTDNILLQAPKCPTTCLATGCDNVKAGKKPRAFLHNTVRMTFHGDARFYAENQRVHLESPVIETFGVLELNAKDKAGSNAMITIKTDSLICHDSLIRKGTGKVQFSTWSGLPKDLPIIKLGYSRRAAPFIEYAYDDGAKRKICRECVDHYKGKVYGPGETPLDTMFIKFGPETEWERQNVMVIDHTVITFLTDSFDHVKGGGVLNARYFVDTTKIRNQVEFWTDKNHERDGHLELISERQMGSKDYAGLYTKHLHLEPIGACGHPTSEMWLPGLALDVITTSTFGGFGIQYTDVHVENGANLNPGFTSLRLRGQCYEQACGTLTMKDLRLDGGAELHFSVGTTRGLNGEFSDAIDVDKLTTYGPVNVNIEIRPCEEIEKRCYPLIYYKSVSPNSLNTLKLHPATVKIDGEEYPLSLNLGTDGVVYLCVGDAQVMDHHARTVTIPTVAGVKTIPGPGIWEVKSRSSFPFRAVYTGKPLVVRTNRMVNGVQEVLGGVKNANGEYEYIIPHVQQEITLTFGPDVVSNEFLAGAAVWSHGEMIYIRVERADIASIYSVAGQLVKRVDLPEGDTSIPMSRGAYVITLKDGSVHKVIVK